MYMEKGLTKAWAAEGIAPISGIADVETLAVRGLPMRLAKRQLLDIAAAVAILPLKLAV